MKNLLFITMLSLSFGTVTDINGNVYETVQIGEQLWMAENLKVTHYNNGDEIQGYSNNLSDPCWGTNIDPYLAEIYGNLYNWFAANDDRGICPAEWHVPSKSELETLIEYVGGSDHNLAKNSELWVEALECDFENAIGFSALPGGSGLSCGLGENLWDAWYGIFITTTTLEDDRVWTLNVTCNGLGFGDWWIGQTYSVRCLSDELIEGLGCTNPEACNYDATANVDDGSCEYEYDCAGDCGGDLEPDCCGVCGGDNSQCSNCCGSPFYEDCSDDCAIDINGECCYELEVDECGVCGGDGTDCNNDGIPDDCEEVYSEGYDLGNADGYTAGLEEGILLGAQSGDVNGDGVLNVIDIVIFVEMIMNP